MKKILFAFIISGSLLLLSGCEPTSISPKKVILGQVDSIQEVSACIKTNPDSPSYFSAKAKIEARRTALATAYFQKKIDLDSVRSAFTDALLNEIIPFWYGTKWSFEGHTVVPKQGEIACGYFVSTTLLDVGMRLNRFKLAQQSPVDEAKMLSLGGVIFAVSRAAADSFGLVFQKNFHDGLYFAGLGGSHVGFLLKKKDSLWFIHSNYTSPAEVVAQPISTSVFIGFDEYFIADLTYNDRLLEHWLAGKELVLSIDNTKIVEIR